MKTDLDRAMEPDSRKAGQTFVIVMMLTGILMIAGASLSYLTSNAGFTSRKINNGVRALAIAEAGVADRLSKMTTNYVAWANASNTASYGGGKYSVVGRMNTDSHIVLITSTGTIGSETRTTALELLGTLYDLWDAAVGVDGAIVAGGNVQVSNPSVINGSISCNGDVLSGPTAGTVNGDISCHGGTCQINGTGTETTGAPLITVPDPNEAGVMDLWRQRAITGGGLYYTNSQDWSGMTLRPTSGVVFVEGNIAFSASGSTVSGTLVATGWIHINNRFSSWKPASNPDWPALIAGLDINDQQRNDYTGDIWAGTTINIDNRRRVTGCLIAVESVTVSGNTDVTSPGGGTAWDPTDTNTAAPPIQLGGWLR